MSDIPQTQASSTYATVLQCFVEAIADVASQLAAEKLTATSTARSSSTEAALTIQLELSGVLAGLCEISVSASMCIALAALLTGESASSTSDLVDETREAAAELIQQICGNAADRLRRTFGVLELKSKIVEQATQSGECHEIAIAHEPKALEFELRILQLTQTQNNIGRDEAGSAQRVSAQQAPRNAIATTEAALSGSHNLDLLLDIELAATLRFGTRQMLLKDIMELCSGSVVELDRHVQDPVDLLIDGRVIARGEVVVVDGNYGLRILQVATPSEKIACLS